jgi:hypothetical protein
MIATVSGLAMPAAAQEVSFGYQMQHFASEGDSFNAPFGVNFSVAGPSSGAVSIVGQLDWSRKHESETVFGTSVDASANFTAFAGGVRFSGRGSRSATPFVEGLFGAMHTTGNAHVAGINVASDSETDPMLQVGGGVSVPVSGALGVFGQFDYRRIFASDTGVNGLRFVGGIRLTTQ